MSKPDLDAIQKRADAATEGPWEHQPYGGQNQNGDYSGGEIFDADGEYVISEISDKDGAFIAAARTDVPALLAYARDLEARLDSVRKVAASWHERYANAPIGDDRIEDALDDEAYKLEDIVNGTDFAALTATEEPA